MRYVTNNGWIPGRMIANVKCKGGNIVMVEGQSADEVLERAAGLMQQHRFAEAIDVLHAACQKQPNALYEQRLAQYRHDAYLLNPPRGLPGASGSLAASEVGSSQPGVIPEIPAERLNAATLAAAISQHGALLVRGLMKEGRAVQLAHGVRQALDACQAWHRSELQPSDARWYTRIQLTDDSDLAEARVWVEEGGGGVWAADSPRMLFELTEFFAECGVVSAIEGYFGERPMLSVGKSTLRCVPSTIALSDWHQDGAFMGSDIRSVNVWLSLSHCGEDASGLECLPKRLSRILPTGSDGAYFHWSVGPGLVQSEAQEKGTVSPVFAPGDALLFDHFFLHRTGIPAAIAKDRYAVESWFFAPSAYPKQQVPLWI
jgi:hypothetical protein